MEKLRKQFQARENREIGEGEMEGEVTEDSPSGTRSNEGPGVIYAACSGISPPADSAIMQRFLKSADLYKKSGCSACGAIAPKSIRCSRCRFALYCSVECLRRDWPSHEIHCVDQLSQNWSRCDGEFVSLSEELGKERQVRENRKIWNTSLSNPNSLIEGVGCLPDTKETVLRKLTEFLADEPKLSLSEELGIDEHQFRENLKIWNTNLSLPIESESCLPDTRETVLLRKLTEFPADEPKLFDRYDPKAESELIEYPRSMGIPDEALPTKEEFNNL